MRLFRRAWRVQIGTLQTSDADLRFKIVRTLQARPGTCELEIFNLTASHRAEAHHARRPIVQVEAGYAEGMSLLFRGDARHVDLARDGTDWVVKATAGDGEHAIRTARAARAFGPDTRLEEVVDYLADQMGVGAGNAREALAGAALDRLGTTFPAGTAIRGPAARELGALLRAAGLEWSVQDGVLQVLPRGRALAREAIVLGPGTGLLGSPEVGRGGLAKAKALLLPDLVPGRQVQLDSVILQGVYRIQKAEYSGETRGDDWTVDLELRSVTT